MIFIFKQNKLYSYQNNNINNKINKLKYHINNLYKINKKEQDHINNIDYYLKYINNKQQILIYKIKMLESLTESILNIN
jgi:hypothetical protein